MAEISFLTAAITSPVTTTSTSFVDVTGARIAAASLDANTKYLLVVSVLYVQRTNTTGYARMRVQTADDTTIESKSAVSMEPQRTGTGDFKRYFFVHSFTTDATPDDIDLQIAQSGTVTTEVDEVRMRVFKLDDLDSADYVEDINAGTGTDMNAIDPNRFDMATIAGSALGTTDEWLVFGYGRVSPGASGRSNNVFLNGAFDSSSAVDIIRDYSESEDPNDYRVQGFVARVKAVTSNVDLKIQSMDQDAQGNFSDEGSYLIAIKTSVFADFAYVRTVGNIAVGTTETTIQTSGSYTPSVYGNHWIIGQAEGNSPGDDHSLWLEDGTTELNPGMVYPTSQDQYWDSAKDLELCSDDSIQNITSGSKTYNVRADTDGAAGAYKNRWIFIINLNLAGGAAVTLESDGPAAAAADAAIGRARPVAADGDASGDGSAAGALVRGLLAAGPSSAAGDAAATITVHLFTWEIGLQARTAAAAGDADLTAGAIIALLSAGPASADGTAASVASRAIAADGPASSDGSASTAIERAAAADGPASAGGDATPSIGRAVAADGPASVDGTAEPSIVRGVAADGPASADGAAVLATGADVPLAADGPAAADGDAASAIARSFASDGPATADGAADIARAVSAAATGPASADGTGAAAASRAIAADGPASADGAAVLAIGGDIALDATAAGTAAATAASAIARALAATAAGTAAGISAADIAKAIAASGAVAAAATAALEAVRNVAAIGPASSAGAATSGILRSIIATAAGAADGAAAIARAAEVASDGPAAAAATSDLSLSGVAELAASGDAAHDGTAAAVISKALASSGPAAGAARGDLTVVVQLGAAPGAASATGTAVVAAARALGLAAAGNAADGAASAIVARALTADAAGTGTGNALLVIDFAVAADGAASAIGGAVLDILGGVFLQLEPILKTHAPVSVSVAPLAVTHLADSDPP